MNTEYWQSRAQAAEARVECLLKEREHVIELVDDVLFNPHVRLVDSEGNRLRGAEVYLSDTPIMTDHLPALRQWFVSVTYTGEAAEAAKEKP